MNIQLLSATLIVIQHFLSLVFG